jgi:hypothetical protein
MRKEKLKEKRFSFFCRRTRKKSGKPTQIWHIAFCPIHKPVLRKSQRAKFFPIKIIDNQLFIIFANRKVHLNLNINKNECFNNMKY